MSSSTSPDLRALLQSSGVLAVLTVEDSETAVPLARALVAGGIAALEVTLRTPCALDAIDAIRQDVPDAIVGAGTVTCAGDLERARSAGAAFAVSPGLTESLSDAARSAAMPFLPGVQTASEALAAREWGWRILKLFPARAAGGPELLRSLAGPYPDLLFCPTGGIDQSTFSSYLDLPNVLCVGGSWMAPQQLIRARDWEQIQTRAEEARRKA